MPTAKWYPTDFDQTHNLIVVAQLQPGGPGASARASACVTGAPDTPMFEGAYDADAGRLRLPAGPTNTTRKPTFNQLDLRVERTWTFNAWQLGAYLDIQNIYNAQNPELRSMIIGAARRYRSGACRSIRFSVSRGCFEAPA